MLRPTPGDPWGVEQHHWNTGAEENQNLYDELNVIDDVSISDTLGENETNLSDQDAEHLECEITLTELTKALKNMKNDKSPGQDGFTVEIFWTDIRVFVLSSLNYAYRTGNLSVTQKQCIITFLPKPNKNRHFLKNWRPISLVNVVYKLASSVIANRIKTVLDCLIHEDQKGFISSRFLLAETT